VNSLLPELLNRLEDECERKVVMSIDSRYAEYFSNAQLFDSTDVEAAKVSGQFPSAAEDIAESGKCLACGRSTACVMHLNRVVEAGLKALALALGSGPQNDWGKYLSNIDKELTARMNASGARTADEQFYAEAQITIDSVRRAWRNPTMHIARTYTEERAEEILIAVRSFMRHLATKLHD
jgi:HEPN domain-containing protein